MIGPLPSREKTLHLFDWSKLTLSGGFDTKEPRNLLPWRLGSADFLGQVVKPRLISISRHVSSLWTQSLCLSYRTPLRLLFIVDMFPPPLSFQLPLNLNKNPLTGQTPKWWKVSHMVLGDNPHIGAGWTSFLGTSTRLSVPHLHRWARAAVCGGSGVGVGRAHSCEGWFVPDIWS